MSSSLATVDDTNIISTFVDGQGQMTTTDDYAASIVIGTIIVFCLCISILINLNRVKNKNKMKQQKHQHQEELQLNEYQKHAQMHPNEVKEEQIINNTSMIQEQIDTDSDAGSVANDDEIL